MNEVLRARGLPEAADHEFHIAPKAACRPPPGDPAARPDPWTWATAHAVSKAKCSGTVHRVVFDRGSITYPDHPPNSLQDAACYRSPDLRAVDEARRAAGPLPYFPLGHFAALGVETVPLRISWETGWNHCPDLEPDPDGERYEQRYGATHHDGELRAALIPPVENFTLHDPLRPDLTAVSVRRSLGLPKGAWWHGPGTLSVSVCLSAMVAAVSSRMALAPGKRPARPGRDGLVRAEVASAGPSGAEWTIHSDLDRTVLHAWRSSGRWPFREVWERIPPLALHGWLCSGNSARTAADISILLLSWVRAQYRAGA